MSAALLEGMREARLLAIIRGTDAEASLATGVALVESGIRHLEVALTTPDAVGVIARLVAEVGDAAIIGAGTVLTADDVARVADAGATFAVTPAVVPSIAECARIGFPVLAGAFTPTEAYTAMEQGALAIKLFPASVGGPAYLKAVRDPFPTIPFFAVGGVGVEQVAQYAAVGAVGVGLGSPLIGDAASGGSLDALRERAHRFLDAASNWPAS